MWAVVISVVAHLAIFLFHNSEPSPDQPEKPRVFHAELQTQIAQRDDLNDQRGEISEQPPATVQPSAEPAPSTPQSTEKTTNPTPPDAVTATSSPVKTQKPAEPPTKAQPVTQPRSSEPDQTVTRPEKKPAPQKRPEPEITPDVQPETPEPDANTPAPPSSLQTQGNEEQFSDPLERAYYELLVAHLNARLPAHPKGIAGKVRLEIKIQFGSVITGVKVIDGSGDQATDNWARKAALSVSPVPPVPGKFEQPYFFRPTLLLTQ